MHTYYYSLLNFHTLISNFKSSGKAYLKQDYVIKFVCNFGVDSALNVYCLALLSTTCMLMALHKQENI